MVRLHWEWLNAHNKNPGIYMTVDLNCSCCSGKTGNILFTGITSVYSDQPWDLAECPACKNIITIPEPTSALLKEIYSTTYLYPVHLLVLGEKKFRSQSMGDFLRKKYPSDKYKSLFEVGCMYGYLLNELRNEYRVKGIEIGDEAVNVCRKQGLDVTETSIEDYLTVNNEKFDLIILSHVFEHLLSPEKILEKLKERLNPGGKLIISIPNSDSFCRKLFGKNWGWWQVPVHINHFRESSIKQLASVKGMNIETVRYKGGDSLMLLLNFINLFGFRKKNSGPGLFQKIIIRLFTVFLRYWYYISNEELTVVMEKKNTS